MAFKEPIVITISGPQGSGKTTVAKLIAEALRDTEWYVKTRIEEYQTR